MSRFVAAGNISDTHYLTFNVFVCMSYLESTLCFKWQELLKNKQITNK